MTEFKSISLLKVKESDMKMRAEQNTAECALILYKLWMEPTNEGKQASNQPFAKLTVFIHRY